MPYVDHHQARIWYLDEGEGPAVLLIHGGLFAPMDGEKFWVRPGIVADLVESGFRVLVPDRRFSGGRTSAPFMTHTWDVEMGDMAAVMQAAGVDQAQVIAGSIGCTVAARLWLANPELVESLLFCWPPHPGDNANYEFSASFVEQNGSAAYLEHLREYGVPHPVLGPPGQPGFPYGVALLADDRTASSFLGLTGREAANIVRETARSTAGGDSMRGVTDAELDLLAGSSLPVTVIPSPDEEQFHLQETVDAIADRVPQATVTEQIQVSPAPDFSRHRGAFCQAAVQHLRQQPRGKKQTGGSRT